MRKYASGSNWHEGAASFTWDGLQALAQAVRDDHIPAAEPVTFADVLADLYSFKDQNLGGELATGDRARGTDPAVPRETLTGILPGWGRMRMSDGPENGSHGSDLRRHGTFSKKDTSRAP
jgi:hypothetical protein